MPEDRSPALAGAAEVVGLVHRLADAQGRDDLAAQLEALRDSLVVRPVRVVVAGRGGTGRSSLVDALVGGPVVPVRDPLVPGSGTVAMTEVAHADEYGALLVPEVVPGQPAEGPRPVPYGDAIGLVDGAHNPGNRWLLRAVHLGVPAAPLARGLTLVDTPPVGPLASAPALRLTRAMAGAAAVVITVPAAEGLTAADLDLARIAQAMSRHVIVALTAADRLDHRTPAVDAALVALEQRGVGAPVFAVDASPYWTTTGGLPPGPDPGMRALARHLEEAVVLDGEQQRISRALTEAFWAADRLRLRLWAEESLIDGGDGLDATIARLRGAARGAQHLCGEDAGWHRELAGGIRRLAADIAEDRRRLTDELRSGALTTSPAAGAPDRGADTATAEALVRLQRVRTLAVRAFARQVAGRFRDEWATVIGSLELGTEAHGLLLPRLERPSVTPERPASALPLPGPEPRSAADAVAEAFSRDTDELLVGLEHDLATRCRDRAVELHRSLVEVLTALTVLRDADAAARDARRDALATGLAALDVLEWRAGGDDAR
ncbi:MAG: hypothetical protein U0Q07_01110 [Acidimicrobiales bacterium]